MKLVCGTCGIGFVGFHKGPHERCLSLFTLGLISIAPEFKVRSCYAVTTKPPKNHKPSKSGSLLVFSTRKFMPPRPLKKSALDKNLNPEARGHAEKLSSEQQHTPRNEEPASCSPKPYTVADPKP